MMKSWSDIRKLIVWLAVPTTLLLVAGVLFVVWILTSSATKLDQSALHGEQQLARSALLAASERLSKAVADYTFWDEMYDQFHTKYDEVWSADNLDAYILDAFTVDIVLAADVKGDVRYAYSRWDQGKATVASADKPGIAKAVALAIRGWTPGKSSAVVGVISIAGRNYLAAAGPIALSSADRLDPKKPPTLALIYLEALDGKWLARLTDVFQFNEPRVIPMRDGATALPDAFGTVAPLGLVWKSRSLGQHFLSDTLPLIIAAALTGIVVFIGATAGWIRVARHLGRALDAAEAASRAKGDFLAMMSHEIRTPMNGVLGMTSVLLRSELTNDQQHAATTIRDSGEALLRIIDDILDFSKLEVGAIALEDTAFDLHVLLSGTVDIVAPRAETKSLRLDVELAPDLPQFVRMDAGRLRQVVLNLLGNAVKFTECGSISLRARTATRQGAPALFVSVTDTGIGIEPSHLGRLFQSFSQGDASIARRFGGSGLGLAISKALIERMGGKISVDSEPGSGSTFWFELPVALASAEDLESASGAHAGAMVDEALEQIRALGRPAKILVVEDNATNLLVAKATLSRFGITPDTAGDGLEALAAVKRTAYDVILMDVQMPVMDGLEVTRAIRALPAPASEVPIIALTANAFRSDVERCLAAGMNGHIGKPFHGEDLIVAIASALRGKDVAIQSARSRAGEVPIADWETIEKFRSSSGEEMLHLLIDTFLQDAAAKLDRLAAIAVSGGGDAEAVRLAHSLKSAGAMAGAGALAALAAEIEARLASNEPMVEADAHEMRRLFMHYRDALRKRGLIAA